MKKKFSLFQKESHNCEIAIEQTHKIEQQTSLTSFELLLFAFEELDYHYFCRFPS